MGRRDRPRRIRRRGARVLLAHRGPGGSAARRAHRLALAGRAAADPRGAAVVGWECPGPTIGARVGRCGGRPRGGARHGNEPGHTGTNAGMRPAGKSKDPEELLGDSRHPRWRAARRARHPSPRSLRWPRPPDLAVRASRLAAWRALRLAPSLATRGKPCGFVPMLRDGSGIAPRSVWLHQPLRAGSNVTIRRDGRAMGLSTTFTPLSCQPSTTFHRLWTSCG